MKLADSHIHLFRNGFPIGPNGPAFVLADEVAAYEGLRARHKIDRALIVGYEGMPVFHGNNAHLARLRRTCRWMAPVAYHDVDRPPSVAQMRRYIQDHFVGISLYVLKPAEADALRSWPASVVNELNRRRAIVSINARPESIRRLSAFVERLEGCSILISHLGLPGALTGRSLRTNAHRRLEALRTLTRFTNVGVKLSGFYAIDSGENYFDWARIYLKELAASLDSRRMYWGSDFSPVLSHVSFSKSVEVVSGSGLPQSALRAIMHDNLIRLITTVEGQKR
jgi:L-fuconolactonase